MLTDVCNTHPPTFYKHVDKGRIDFIYSRQSAGSGQRQPAAAGRSVLQAGGNMLPLAAICSRPPRSNRVRESFKYDLHSRFIVYARL